MLLNSRPCDADPSQFWADGLNTDDYVDLDSPESFSERALEQLEGVVSDTVDALRICAECPLLAECREFTAELLAAAAPPINMVQAGVYWGEDGRPDFTLNGTVSDATATAARESAAVNGLSVATRTDEDGQEWPLTVPVWTPPAKADSFEVATAEGPIDTDLGVWDLTWLPPVAEPINPAVVALAVENVDAPRVIPQAKAECNPEFLHAGLEPISDADACEIIRRLFAAGFSTRRIAKLLSISSPAAKNAMQRLGLPVISCERRRLAAIEREARHAEERALQLEEIEAPVDPEAMEADDEANVDKYQEWEEIDAPEYAAADIFAGSSTFPTIGAEAALTLCAPPSDQQAESDAAGQPFQTTMTFASVIDGRVRAVRPRRRKLTAAGPAGSRRQRRLEKQGTQLAFALGNDQRENAPGPALLTSSGPPEAPG